MISATRISFLSTAEKATLAAYHGPRENSVLVSEIVSRLAAAILLPLGALLDIVFHSLLTIPTFIYAACESIFLSKADFQIPWQHLQRVRNAIAPLLLGSILGIAHPFGGLYVSEPTDKHIVVGMLSSNTNQKLDTPCSPIHSLSIINDLARTHPYVETKGIRREIFPPEYSKMIQETKHYEASLEILQAQEYIHKITNITLFVMASINTNIEESTLSETGKKIALRLSGVLIPVLSLIDTTIALIAQGVFLSLGLVRLISGRGPLYTEVTVNPLMHVSFLTQNALKLIGNLIGSLVWFAEPMKAFKVSLLTTHLFFKMQMAFLTFQIKLKMACMKEKEKFILPILFGTSSEATSSFSVPIHTAHKTYLIVEKEKDQFNLYWVNRPNVTLKQGLDAESAFAEITSMLHDRFPFMDIEKMMEYPITYDRPAFSDAVNFATIDEQGNSTNCEVSNFFGTLEILDKLRGEDDEVTRLRNESVRSCLRSKYSFYKSDFYPFTNLENGYFLKPIWKKIKSFTKASI